MNNVDETFEARMARKEAELRAANDAAKVNEMTAARAQAHKIGEQIDNMVDSMRVMLEAGSRPAMISLPYGGGYHAVRAVVMSGGMIVQFPAREQRYTQTFRGVLLHHNRAGVIEDELIIGANEKRGSWDRTHPVVILPEEGNTRATAEQVAAARGQKEHGYTREVTVHHAPLMAQITDVPLLSWITEERYQREISKSVRYANMPMQDVVRYECGAWERIDSDDE